MRGCKQTFIVAFCAPIQHGAIIGPAHRLCVISVVALGFPLEGQGWIDDRRLQPFFIKAFDAALGVERAYSRVGTFTVGNAWIPSAALACISEGAKNSSADGGTARDLGGTSIDLQVLDAVAGPFELRGAGFVYGFAVFEPQFWTFDEMAVGVDRAGIAKLMKCFFLVFHRRGLQ